MMGRQSAPEELFYRFRLEDRIPEDHPLRLLDAVSDLSVAVNDAVVENGNRNPLSIRNINSGSTEGRPVWL